MQATIERTTPTVASRCVLRETPTEDGPNAYKAPLATFLVLVASARASACAAAAGAPHDTALTPDVHV